MSEPTTRPSALSQRDFDELVSYMERRQARININNQGFNGSTKFVNWMLTVLALLMTAAIAGEVTVYGQVQVLQSTVNYIIEGHMK